jgi:predicted RNase H-like HicB family nuclease
MVIMSFACTGIIKKSGNFFIGLCLELNIASQGDSVEEATQMLQEACEEYLSFIREEGREDEIKPVSLEILREFLIADDSSGDTPDRLFSQKITLSGSACVS